MLTNALRNVETLPSSIHLVNHYSRFSVTEEAAGNIQARDAVLIREELNKVTLLLFSLIAFVFSAVSGIFVGVLRHNLNDAIEVCGVMLGVIGIVEGWSTWWIK